MKYVSRWASVASWGHLSRHEGAWGALWACGWLLGSQDEGSRGPKKEVSKIQGASESPQKQEKSRQEAPKSIQNEPKRARKHNQEHL